MSGRDINGSFRISKALNQIKGIGKNLASALTLSIERTHGIPPETKIGSLSDEQLSKIEAVVKDPKAVNIPPFMLNRRKEHDSGADMHLVGTDLIVKVRNDIDSDIKMETWRGFRHRYGQKVRGQRTRSTGRTGATVGVMKKTVEAAAKAATQSEKKPGAGGGAAAPAAAAPAAAPAAEEKK
ncbi:MAG: 30S ribosomal protein S13 [Candidatus Micrarchaeota archaeon]|nr:30S ribosomal protein S13 [Candidatus Micrarchaeota archaeon]MDE1849762.1 30S ribosomal protein S13 [Candidatus Micrarchaeota archaeon]